MSRVLLVFLSLVTLHLVEWLPSARADVTGGTYGQSVGVVLLEEGPRPASLEVGPGVTVSWVNRSKHPARIRFLAEGVSTTCKAPRGFELNKTGVYESELIGPGDIASLCFLEPSKYPYSVSYQVEAAVVEPQCQSDCCEETPMFEVILPEVLECQLLLSMINSDDKEPTEFQGLVEVIEQSR